MSGRDDETRAAFIGTTAFMTILPLVALGAAVWWLRRRLRELEGGPERESEGTRSKEIGVGGALD